MVSPFQRLVPGDGLPTSSKTWNALLDAAQQIREDKGGQLPSAGETHRPSGSQTVIQVKNVGTALIDYWHPIRLLLPNRRVPGGVRTRENWAISPADNANIPRTPVLEGQLAENTALHHTTALALEPIPPQKIGRAVFCGYAPAMVTSESLDILPTHAEPFYDATGVPPAGTITMQGTYCGYPIIAREKGAGPKAAIVDLSQREPARVHAWCLNFHSQTFTGSHNSPSGFFNASAFMTTNAPHFMRRTATAIHFGHRFERTWKLHWIARVAMTCNNTTRAAFSLRPLVTTGNKFQLLVESNTGNATSLGPWQTEISGTAVFRGRRTSFDTSLGPELSWIVNASTHDASTASFVIEAIDIWIEEIFEVGIPERFVPLSSAAGAGAAMLSNAMIADPGVSGSGSANVTPAGTGPT